MMTGSQRCDLRNIMVQTFLEATEKNINLAVIVSDSTSTSKIKPFIERYCRTKSGGNCGRTFAGRLCISHCKCCLLFDNTRCRTGQK